MYAPTCYRGYRLFKILILTILCCGTNAKILQQPSEIFWFPGEISTSKKRKSSVFRFESGESSNPIHDVFFVLTFHWLFSMKLQCCRWLLKLRNLHTKNEADLLIGRREVLWSQGGFLGFQVTGMIEGFLWVWNFLPHPAKCGAYLRAGLIRVITVIGSLRVYYI